MFDISVVIPTYNRSHLLGRALDSVDIQTVQPLETIVIDDGSTDDTAALIKKKEASIRYQYQNNKGVSAARNSGINLCQGEWIAFLDSDDEWMPEKLEIQMQVLAANPGMKICHSEEIWVRNGQRVNAMNKHAKQGGWIFRHCLPLCVMSPSSIIIHRSVFKETGLFDESLPACEDYDLWLRITARYPVLFVSRPLIRKYGGHEDQLSTKFWGMDRFRIEALKNILDWPDLKPEYRQAAVDMLIKKLTIYINGAKKRGREMEVEAYIKLLERYT